MCPDPDSTANTPSPAMRCAIYARVSVAETDPNKFTSLEAQIAACEQYIASQRGKDWGLAYAPFTDDGLSGANLKRPGLRSLLKLVNQGEVEVIVVHRLDRLTRSLFDLETLLPLFELKGVALASVTEQLNTHTPGGRLSLNLLTTFAEYEREAIGERTRDKLSAARRRGGWQGSGTPLGYGVDFEQRLIVIDHEANGVREIFRRYLAAETMAEMMAWLAHQQVKTKNWVTRDGKPRGGQPMDRTTLYRILNNRMYIGEAMFDGEWHSRVYPPIIDLDLWRAVQTKLAQRARRKGIPNQGRAIADFPLLGKLFWHDGREYTAFESSPRGKKHYRYYIGPVTAQEKAADQPPFTFSTDEIHQMVIHHLRTQFRDPNAWLPALLQRAGSDSGLNDTRIRQALIRLDEVWGRLADFTVASILFQLIKRVTLQPDGARIEVDMAYLYSEVVSFDEVGQAADASPCS
jgi:site-specific DNA recombinase